jgi:hypothetical protein
MGFFIWHSVSSSRIITRIINVPIYFDNIKTDMHIHAPESSDITIAGVRKDIQKTYQHGAIHVDSTNLSAGKQLVHITYKNFLLPSAVKVLNYNPLEVTLTTVVVSDQTAHE